MRLAQFKALSFDCYGTLIDWESGMMAALGPLASRAPNKLSRDDILQAHARNEAEAEAQTPARPYRDILATVYRRLAEQWSVRVDWAECVEYGSSVGNWEPFGDSVEALRYLKRHFRLIILSNVDNHSFAATNAKLRVMFDAIYTAEEVGSYKPSPRNFEYLLSQAEALGLRKQDILHVAESIFHDHVPAEAIGLASCLIHRRHDQDGFGATRAPAYMPSLPFRFESLAGLVEAHRREVGDDQAG